MADDTQVLEDLLADLMESDARVMFSAADLIEKITAQRAAERPSPELTPDGALPVRDLDLDYLDRLERAIHPESGDCTTRVWRYAEGGDEGKVAIWQVQVRGDDVLGLIRLARPMLGASPALCTSCGEPVRPKDGQLVHVVARPEGLRDHPATLDPRAVRITVNPLPHCRSCTCDKP